MAGICEGVLIFKAIKIDENQHFMTSFKSFAELRKECKL